MIEPKTSTQKLIALIPKVLLVFWMGGVVFVYVIIYWPPVLRQVAEGLGMTGLIWDLKLFLEPFFTAPFGSG